MSDKYIIGSPDKEPIQLDITQIKKITALFALSNLRVHSFCSSAEELGLSSDSIYRINLEWKEIMELIEKEYDIHFTDPFSISVCIKKVLDGEIKPYQPD